MTTSKLPLIFLSGATSLPQETRAARLQRVTKIPEVKAHSQNAVPVLQMHFDRANSLPVATNTK